MCERGCVESGGGGGGFWGGVERGCVGCVVRGVCVRGGVLCVCVLMCV